MLVELIVVEPWEFGPARFTGSVPDEEIAAATFPGDQVTVKINAGVSLGGRTLTSVTLKARHFEYPLSLLAIGSRITVNGAESPAGPLLFIADARRAR